MINDYWTLLYTPTRADKLIDYKPILARVQRTLLPLGLHQNKSESFQARFEPELFHTCAAKHTWRPVANRL